MKLIDKVTVVAEIEKRIEETESMQPKFDQFWAGQISAFKGILKILNTLEVKEVQEEPVSNDLEREIKHYVYDPYFDLNGVAVKGATYYLTVEDVADIARHFAQWQKEQMMKDAFDAEYFDGSVFRNDLREIYKDGDNVKVIIIKEE